MTGVHGGCHLCGAMVFCNHKRLICHDCQTLITPLPTFVINANKPLPLMVCGHYDTPFDHVMSAYKDHENLSALMVLYHLIRQLPQPNNLSYDNAVIIPTPTTKNRLIKRGFNPALTLAKYLSHHWQIPIFDIIKRTENTVHQRGLDRDERLQNVKNDFYITDYPTTRYVILFDDVVTTGATLTTIANLLTDKNPKQQLFAVGVLHGKAGLHLPIYQR